MKLIAPASPLPLVEWLKRTHGIEWVNQPSWLFGVIDDTGSLRGCIALEQRNEGAGEFHVWGQVSNDVAKDVFTVIFKRLAWRRVECRISRNNKAVRKAAVRWGWKFEGVAREYFGVGEDAFQFSMTAAECRWIKDKEHGQVA